LILRATLFLFIVEDESDRIVLPLVKRPIEGTEYYDCSSVYGYAGPLSNKPPKLLSRHLIKGFQQSLKEYCEREKIISVFSRLHPIIEQSELLIGLGEIEALNKTICIDLDLPPEEQWQQYRKSNKYEIGQLRKAGFVIKKADTQAEIDEFLRIYTDTMKRVNASSMYFFDKEYFYNFLNAKDFESILLLAYKGSEVAAGSIFTITKNIMQYHLAGTDLIFIKDSPMKLIIDEARLLGIKYGLKSLHLGGGVGGQDDDPLYRFKSGFSEKNFRFEVWKYIVDEQKYSEVVREREKQKPLNIKYFPLYRG